MQKCFAHLYIVLFVDVNMFFLFLLLYITNCTYNEADQDVIQDIYLPLHLGLSNSGEKNKTGYPVKLQFWINSKYFLV